VFFIYFNGTGSVYVCIGKSTEVQAMWPGLHYSVNLPIQTYTDQVPLSRNMPQNIPVYTDIFHGVATSTTPRRSSSVVRLSLKSPSHQRYWLVVMPSPSRIRTTIFTAYSCRSTKCPRLLLVITLPLEENVIEMLLDVKPACSPSYTQRPAFNKRAS